MSVGWGQECDEGYVPDCSGDGDCAPADYVGDDVCDGTEQAYGYDLTCYDIVDGEIVGGIGETFENGGDGGDCDGSCPDGFVVNCNPADGDACCSEDWVGDGFYCDDGQDDMWGCDLTCYDNDGGDCDEVLEATLSFGEVDLASQTIEINLENSAPVSGFQFEVNSTINIIDVSGGSAEDMGFMVDFSENNNIVLGFSPDGNEIPTGSAALTVLGFDGYGEASVCLSQASIVSGYEDAQYFNVSYGDCITLDYMKGDVNLDESLDILDIVTIINIIFEYIIPTEYELWAADYSSDGAIDIMDIVQIINCILVDDCAGSDSGGACIDIDGNVYETIQIGEQVWMAENLKTTHYNNEDEIPTGYSDSEWAELETGAYAVYDDDPVNADIYGNLYNWYTVDDSRGVCPDGWHVPSDEEIMELEMYLGMSEEDANSTSWRGTNEGSKLAGNSDLWWYGDLVNNSEFGTSGFDALPAGYRGNDNGNYTGVGFYGYFWLSSEYYNYAWYRSLHFNSSNVLRYNSNKQGGYSIRCLED